MGRLHCAVIGAIALTSALNANEHYLLPEHHSDLIHTLQQKIARASHLTFITGELKEPSLARSIEKALHKGARFDLITSDTKSAGYYAKYRNTHVRVPTDPEAKEHFGLNLLIIDESDVCISSIAFSEAVLRRQMGEVICTTNAEEIEFALEIKRRFGERFEAYAR